MLFAKPVAIYPLFWRIVGLPENERQTGCGWRLWISRPWPHSVESPDPSGLSPYWPCADQRLVP
jgi:hypothetical protein